MVMCGCFDVVGGGGWWSVVFYINDNDKPALKMSPAAAAGIFFPSLLSTTSKATERFSFVSKTGQNDIHYRWPRAAFSHLSYSNNHYSLKSSIVI